MKPLLFGFMLASLLLGCASAKKNVQRTTDSVFASPFYDQQFTGVLILDAGTKDTLYARNSEKYFTPASNTKIFTLFAALQFLPDKIPALKYVTQNDTLYVEGTGDPSFLHPHFMDSTALNFLHGHRNISLHLDNFVENRYGPGWAWGDYQYYYQPERTAFPLYGNVVTLHNSESVKVVPTYLYDKVVPIDYTLRRELDRNLFYFGKTRKDTLEIPFKTDTTLIKTLLEDVLGKKLSLADRMPAGEKNVLYSLPSDSLYRRMMHKSDNMIAEQLLILASSTLSDTLDGGKVRDSVLSNQLADLEQPPRWVDGSGLSRYNLFTPESMVQVLSKLHEQVPEQRLFDIFPAGGVSGTLEDWYPGNPDPYIYAKTGTLGNVHCVSGYLVTNSGKTLIFSFMNNHYRHQSSEIKKRMQLIFETIRDTY
ncbi:D-alanyl-D-alanine carboxypeptidase [Pricia sp. S334]|uniref:D-alanyl-D-alanine carboxypeptidase n=1 Tax=Pricia mediterranea TaxID=3076079 RepID=A0ABU3L019_9FLAO|nr:D-alanyl-D-alanine carboxypeptidase [Pricia sp. S334]MDT7827075.1 D-alanyl-D-alanine carboxypeptidase [Pricia sp. S334]